ncbi:MAG: amidohydrolase, partial [Defluviitaleaceae bacterium]|nr:amidohydrolase [Defluviitaleaceae bacterium]
IVEAGAAFAKGLRAKGCVGMKMMVFKMKKPDAAAANDALAALLKDESAILSSSNPLNDIFYDAIFTEMARQELPVSVHTGVWGDFRDLNPEHAIYMSDNYPDLKFDLFHLGYPYSREAIVMGKLRRNIWLNLCWTQIISPYFTTQALIEILEAIPSNKIIGFGGDYMVVEKVYGHLQLALSVIAKALAAKINDGFLSCDAAARLAEKMLYDNPKALYQL